MAIAVAKKEGEGGLAAVYGIDGGNSLRMAASLPPGQNNTAPVSNLAGVAWEE